VPVPRRIAGWARTQGLLASIRPASAASCDLTLAERIVGAMGLDAWLPDVLMAMASRSDAKVNLLGVPYEFWSLAPFVALGAAALAVLRRPA
jgi:disulfide bond formation protein DsbB